MTTAAGFLCPGLLPLCNRLRSLIAVLSRRIGLTCIGYSGESGQLALDQTRGRAFTALAGMLRRRGWQQNMGLLTWAIVTDLTSG